MKDFKIVRKILDITKDLNDPKHPLLGPSLRGLYLLGLWHKGNKFRSNIFKFVYLFSAMFVVSQLTELYQVRKDLMAALFNLSFTALGLVSFSKTVSFFILNKNWMKLIQIISEEEIATLKSNDLRTLDLVEDYTVYARVLTYVYWTLVLLTNLALVSMPFLKYASAPDYRQSIKNGTEPYPQILSSWFPFDNTRGPGYIVALIVHIIIGTQGGGVIAVYDTNAVSIMAFLKGELIILRDKTSRLFDGDLTEENYKVNIGECHRLHNFIIESHALFNSCVSPVNFIYVLVCSIMICCSVIQITMENVSLSQKLWILEFTGALIFQLFLYCWHSNEIYLASEEVSLGIFESNWWRATPKMRKQLVLLAGKLNSSLILDAGPFTKLSIPTFVNIVKGSYSFYTLFTQMQE